jgi:hypothetical protein
VILWKGEDKKKENVNMPRCIRCNEFFPPNYTEVVPGSSPDPLNNNEYPQECVFCAQKIDKVERETSHNSGEYTFYTKEECIKDYKEFLAKVKDSQNVKDILKKSDEEAGFKI